ncbi:hypothetical protein P692DRAFT_20346529 [Suillus brevipes Sb2]|nr:hypothetical protein P692DRAFT_20346529 [Suillus brevipes Sb2]
MYLKRWIFFLTVQAATVLVRRPRYGDKISRHRGVLLFYILITFMLGTVGFAANACNVYIVLIDTSTGIVWYNINIELAYLCIEVGLTVMYTIFTANHLLVIRNQMKQIMPEYDSSTYDIVVLVVIESVVLYSVFAIIFIVSFALHSNVSNLCLLSISHVQGIVQLLIIICVAPGRSYTHEWPTRVAAAPTTVVFSGTVFDTTSVEAAPEQCDAQLHAPVVSTAEVNLP